MDHSRDRGSAAVEVTLLVPMLLALLLFVVAAARLTSARLTVNEAAHQAARTLTLARDPATAQQQARAAAVAVTTGKNLPCRTVDVAVTLPPPRPQQGGDSGPFAVATVTLSCTVPLADLTGLALPSTTTVTGTATSPLDRYRGTP